MTDPTAIPNFMPSGGSDGDAQQAPLRDQVAAALANLGVTANVDGDGDLEFTVNDQTLFARVAEAEPPLLRIFGQWQFGEPVPEDHVARLQRANDVTLQLNLAKVSVVEQSLVGTVELIVLPGSPLELLVQIGVGQVLGAVSMYFESFSPEAAAAAEAAASGAGEAAAPRTGDADASAVPTGSTEGPTGAASEHGEGRA